MSDGRASESGEETNVEMATVAAVDGTRGVTMTITGVADMEVADTNSVEQGNPEWKLLIECHPFFSDAQCVRLTEKLLELAQWAKQARRNFHNDRVKHYAASFLKFAESSPSDEDDTLLDAEDGDEDSWEIELEKMVKVTTNPRPRSDARYSLRRRVQLHD